MNEKSPRTRLNELARERILVLDGAMGTMIQAHKLGEARLPGRALPRHARPQGDNDLLVLTQPES